LYYKSVKFSFWFSMFRVSTEPRVMFGGNSEHTLSYLTKVVGISIIFT